MKFRVYLLLIGFLAGLHTKQAHSQISFIEISGSLGIQHSHQSAYQLGGGVAIFDFDNDGWEDIYLTGGAQSDKLLRNTGTGSFQDVSVSSGISALPQVQSFGVITGDIDNDGYRDILVTTEIGTESQLLRNQGNGTFVLLTNAFHDGTSWKTAASFGDVNHDGWLDIVITAYVENAVFIDDSLGTTIGFQHECSPNKLFLNNGDLSFTDVSSTYGIDNDGCGLAVAFTDFDNDLDMDIMLANDFGEWVIPSTLHENQFPNPIYTDVGSIVGMDFGIYGMGIAIGDYDKDADLDYYQTNLGRNVLSRNDGGVFTDWTTEANCENDSTGDLLHTSWGTFFFDADNDSWPDLFVANGQINAAPFIENYPNDPNKLYRNNGDGTFSDISEAAGIASGLRARGAAFGDLNKDGRLDIVVNNVHFNAASTHFEIFQNQSVVGNWVAFKLIGVQSNRDAFGAHIRLVQNGVSVLAEVDGGSSHASQNSSVVHFGLGSGTLADSVIITFPSGIERVLTEVQGSQIHQVFEDITISVSDDAAAASYSALVGTTGLCVFSNRSGNVQIRLLDISGRMIWEDRANLSMGKNDLDFWITSSSGVYILQIGEGRELENLRVILP